VHWQPYTAADQIVALGPVPDSNGSWGLGVLEAEDEDQLRAFAADDPVVTTGTGHIEIGKMLTGFDRRIDRLEPKTCKARAAGHAPG
jgi:uncharacterized protein